MRMLTLLCAYVIAATLSGQRHTAGTHVLRDTLTLLDTARQRAVPTAIYRMSDTPLDGRPVILFSHGYNANRAGTYLLYRWLLDPLVQDGHVVVSVQHELPDDPPLPMSGDLRIARLPSWESGVANLRHVLEAIRRSYPELSYDRLTLIGHSQGGDISMLFATRYPDLLQKVITLDNRRFPLLRAAVPRVYSIRSSDQPADVGVLPTAEERMRHWITVVFPDGIGHNDMGNRGTLEQQAMVLSLVRRFLAD